MAPAYKASQVTERLEVVALQNQAVLGLRWIHYGNDITIPETPALVIEPGSHKRELSGGPFQIMHTFEVACFIYSTGFDGSTEIQKTTDRLSEDLMKVFDTAAAPVDYGGDQLNGLLIHGHCTDLDYGFLRADDRTMRANRITFTGISKTRMIENG